MKKLIKEEKYEELRKINVVLDICPTCLEFRGERVYHCKKCDICVKDFYFHSNLFKKCINK
jgi:hypothetical protein